MVQLFKNPAVPHAPCPTCRFLYTNYESTDEVLAHAGDWHGAVPTVMSMADVFFGHNGFVWNEKVQVSSAVRCAGMLAHHASHAHDKNAAEELRILRMVTHLGDNNLGVKHK